MAVTPCGCVIDRPCLCRRWGSAVIITNQWKEPSWQHSISFFPIKCVEFEMRWGIYGIFFSFLDEDKGWWRVSFFTGFEFCLDFERSTTLWRVAIFCMNTIILVVVYCNRLGKAIQPSLFVLFLFAAPVSELFFLLLLFLFTFSKLLGWWGEREKRGDENKKSKDAVWELSRN